MSAPYALHIAIEPREPLLGGPIALEIALVNRTSETARIGQKSLVFDWRYQLATLDDTPVPLTRYGEEGRRAAESGAAAAALRLLAPGETLRMTVPLHDIFAITAPGAYRLTVCRTLPTPGGGPWMEVCSDPLEFHLHRH